MKLAMNGGKLVDKNHPKVKILIFLAIIVIFILGAQLRFFHLTNQSYWMDEGFTINAVLSINENGNTVLDSGQNYSCPTYCYPTSYISKILGDNAFSYRLLSVLSGILLIIVIFLFAKSFSNIYIALLSSFFVSFSYFEIAWSRQARWYTLFALFFWLAIYFYSYVLSFLRTRESSQLADKLDPRIRKNDKSKKIWKKWLHLILTILFTILAILTHGLGWILPLFMILWLSYVLVKQSVWRGLTPQKNNLYSVKALVTILGILVVFLGLAYLIYLKYGFILHYNLPYYLSFYLRSYWIFFIFALIAIFNKEVSKKARNNIYFLLSIFLIYLIPLTFFTKIVQYRYLFHVVPAILILGSIGIYEVLVKIKKPLLKILFILGVFLIFFLTQEGVLLPRTNYFLESDDPTKSYGAIGGRETYLFTPQPDWNGAYEFIMKDMSKTPFDTGKENIVISSQPEFNKIFLNQPGYWIKYSYIGDDQDLQNIKDDKEFYVGAKVIDDLPEFLEIASTNHGFIIFDYLALGRMDPKITGFIQGVFSLVYHQKTNNYSEIWIYKF